MIGIQIPRGLESVSPSRSHLHVPLARLTHDDVILAPRSNSLMGGISEVQYFVTQSDYLIDTQPVDFKHCQNKLVLNG